jgi:hypothetical protein
MNIERNRAEGPMQSKTQQSEVFLTEQQLAARHQRSAKTLRNARVHGGYIPFVKIGRNIRYRLSDVIKYEEANVLTSTSGWGIVKR